MHIITIHNTKTNKNKTKTGNIEACIQALHNLGYRTVPGFRRYWVYEGSTLVYKISYRDAN